MKYFLGITDIEQAKLRYRKLAKQLHPDAGGTAIEFQDMQQEYKEVLNQIYQCKQNIKRTVVTPEKEFLSELGKLANVLIKKQVPQNYLRQKIRTTESTFHRSLFGNIVSFLDKL